mmetsp:Transcript_4702/g.10956  ORF Transcript_4702/g.10956 Transcript_4702/m.10956 type:complete len:265 (+) Transcript_4702:651-1445(+)
MHLPIGMVQELRDGVQSIGLQDLCLPLKLCRANHVALALVKMLHADLGAAVALRAEVALAALRTVVPPHLRVRVLARYWLDTAAEALEVVPTESSECLCCKPLHSPVKAEWAAHRHRNGRWNSANTCDLEIEVVVGLGELREYASSLDLDLGHARLHHLHNHSNSSLGTQDFSGRLVGAREVYQGLGGPHHDFPAPVPRVLERTEQRGDAVEVGDVAACCGRQVRQGLRDVGEVRAVLAVAEARQQGRHRLQLNHVCPAVRALA